MIVATPRYKLLRLDHGLNFLTVVHMVCGMLASGLIDIFCRLNNSRKTQSVSTIFSAFVRFSIKTFSTLSFASVSYSYSGVCSIMKGKTSRTIIGSMKGKKIKHTLWNLHLYKYYSYFIGPLLYGYTSTRYVIYIVRFYEHFLEN